MLMERDGILKDELSVFSDNFLFEKNPKAEIEEDSDFPLNRKNGENEFSQTFSVRRLPAARKHTK